MSHNGKNQHRFQLESHILPTLSSKVRPRGNYNDCVQMSWKAKKNIEEKVIHQ